MTKGIMYLAIMDLHTHTPSLTSCESTQNINLRLSQEICAEELDYIPSLCLSNKVELSFAIKTLEKGDAKHLQMLR